MKPTSMNETDRLIMNQLCKVCGEPAAGYHFGAFTCEGCKSFFGRTYNNLSALGECKNNGECVINKKNRTSCKSCRLKKCLMVGMSKSGSRYGRRSNWFKIHCLIQDQQEMSNRMAEQGLAATTAGTTKNGSADDLKISDPKEFLAKYKENELRNNSVVPNLNELTAAAAAAAAVQNQNDSSHSHRISPRLAASPSTTNSEGSLGGHRSVSSPFHPGLFDSAKIPLQFTNPYLPAAAAAAAANAQAAAAAAAAGSNAFNANDFQKEFNQLANRFNSATIPLAPISPLSPLNAAVSRLFLQNTSAIFGKRFNELQKLQSEQLLLNQAQRLLNPALNEAVFKQQQQSSQSQQQPTPASKDLVEQMTNGMRELYGDLPEQDGPIDLSVRTRLDYKELSLTAAMTDLMMFGAAGAKGISKQIPGDHDSGFSPSSNEDNHNTSPLDLTSSTTTTNTSNNSKQHHNNHHHNNHQTLNNNKRPCISSISQQRNSASGKSAQMMMMKNNSHHINNHHNHNNHFTSSKELLEVMERTRNLEQQQQRHSNSSSTGPSAKQQRKLKNDDDDEDIDVEDEDENVHVDDDEDDVVDDDCGGDGDDETSDIEVKDVVDHDMTMNNDDDDVDNVDDDDDGVTMMDDDDEQQKSSINNKDSVNTSKNNNNAHHPTKSKRSRNSSSSSTSVSGASSSATNESSTRHHVEIPCSP